jgi:hypothetical protein
VGSIVEKKQSSKISCYRHFNIVFFKLVRLYLLIVFFDNGKLKLKTVIDLCVRLCSVVATAESMTILLNRLE